jgi:hypothetical protein
MRSAEKAPTTRAWKRLRSVSICVCIYSQFTCFTSTKVQRRRQRAPGNVSEVSVFVCVYIVSFLALLVQKYKGADNARLEAASKRQYLCVCIYSQFTCFTSTKVQNARCLEAASKRQYLCVYI